MGIQRVITNPIVDNHIAISFHEGKIKFISYGESHIMIVTKNNEIYGYGGNTNGQLGLNNVKNTLNFVKITEPSFNEIKYLYCGDFFTIIINENNNIYFTGTLEWFYTFHEFTRLELLTSLQNKKINFIRGINDHLFIVTKNSLYGLGSNKYGKLGIKKMRSCSTLQKILKLKIKDLQSGSHHSILLDENGSIYGTGCNSEGQLGLGDTNDRSEFTKINFNCKVSQITCNFNSSIILTEFNEIFGAGDNYYGLVGLKYFKLQTYWHQQRNAAFTKIVIGDFDNINIKNIYKSYGAYNLILSNSNEIFVAGYNENEMLGIKTEPKSDCISTFTKLEQFNLNTKYFKPLLLYKTIYLLTTDYKINENVRMEETLNQLKYNLLNKLTKCQLHDMDITF